MSPRLFKSKITWYAVCDAPRPDRPYYKAVGSGRTEEEALLALAAKLVQIGGPKHGEIKTFCDDSPV